MSDTTPNLSTSNAQTPSDQMPNTSTQPSSAVAVTQMQSDYDNSMSADVLLAASQMMHDEVYDETLLAQTPNIESPTQPIIAAATKPSPKGVSPTPINLFNRIADRKWSYQKESNGEGLQKNIPDTCGGISYPTNSSQSYSIFS